MKRIIALITVATIVIMVLNISAFATSEPSAMTPQEYKAAQSYLIEKYCNGEITFTQWQEQQAAVNTQFLESNKSVGDAAYALAVTTSNQFSGVAQKISSAFQKWGDGARERVSEWWNGVTQNVPTENTQTSTMDMQGYGAVIVFPDGDIDYCQYVIRYVDNPNGSIYEEGPRKRVTSYGLVNTYNYSVSFGSDTSTWKYYGDVRWNDGTQAPTDDEFEYGTIKKFDEMPEKDLDDILNDFAEEAERQNPDLSSIEGLLNAIYARMGKLDSDNDNALLSAINANILALVNADKDKDEAEDKTNEELVNTLLEIRDSLKNGTLGTSPEAHGHEISGTVYNVIPLDKNWLNKIFHDKENLKVEYEKKVYYLEDCGCLKLGDKYYTPNMNYDSYAIADYDFSNDDIELDISYLGFSADNPLNLYDNLSITQRKKIDNIVNSIYQMVTYSIPYAAITSAFAPFEVIIFNTAVPNDIVLNFDGSEVSTGVSGIESFSVVVLSTDFFLNPYVSKAMGIVKPLLTVIIGYCWLKVMRRKVVSM